MPGTCQSLALRDARHEHRAAERCTVRLTARLREQGHSGLEVAVHNLSTHGFMAETVYPLHAGTLVWLRMPGLAARSARVRWLRDHRIGCAFEEPLHPAVFETLLADSIVLR